MTIEEEIEHLFTFLSHKGGFDVDMGGTLCIRPISEDSPPTLWEVDWTEDPYAKVSPAFPYQFSKQFSSLRAAIEFFVEKRHLTQNGLDF